MPDNLQSPKRLPSHEGILIVFEGIDGTGKSTHVRLLAEALRGEGYEVVTSKEPTDGVHGEKVRASGFIGRLSAQEELDLFLLDRREHLEKLIFPAMSAGKIVILDRYYFSTMAYQGLRGFDPEDIRKWNEEFAPPPTLLFILDLEIETAIQRIGDRDDVANEFEKKESLSLCRDIFLSLKTQPFASVMDASQPIAEIAKHVLGRTLSLLRPSDN